MKNKKWLTSFLFRLRFSVLLSACIILFMFSKSVLALPDLVVQSVLAPEYAPVGGTISSNVTVKNQGTNLTSGTYVVLRLIVSPDTTINLADTYYTEVNIPNSNLLGGYSTSVNVSYTLPSNLTGPYYVGAYIDSWQYHAESNENNNANYDSTPLFIGPPSTPTGLSLTQITGGFRISWNNVSGATSYKIYWGTNSSVSETNYSGILTTGSTPYDHTGLSSGTTYYYRIMACNSFCSGLSDIVSGLYQVAPFDLTVSVDSIPPNPSNVQQGTTVSISCTVSRTGGSLPGSGQFVRVYLYLNQSQGTLTGAQEICGETCAFDFQQATLEDGIESQSKIVTIPSSIKGPYYIVALVDGPGHWSESNENNNLSSSAGTMAIWQPGTPPPDEPMGTLARTWDNSNVYWIKYSKKWPFVNQQTFFNLGYTDAEVEWYGSSALNGFALGKTILNNNDRFCYRSETDSTVYVIESGQSHPFFQWSNFLGQGFTEEDIYWAKPLGATWIQSVYPKVDAPMIRVEPKTLNY